MGRVITGHSSGLIKAMQEAGILPDNCRRVIIDIQFDAVVKLYYECYGDTKLLEIYLPGHLGAMIKETEKVKNDITADEYHKRRNALING